MGGLVQAVFDPAGVLGNWEDTPGGPAQPVMGPDYNVVEDIRGKMQGGMPSWFGGGTPEERKQRQQHEQMQGFMEQMGASSDPMASAFNPNGKVKPSDWSAQWSYAPGKGPQWIEPKRVSPDNDVPYAAVVNNGPAKGNRF